MKVNDVYSTLLKKEDLQDAPRNFTIKLAKMVEFENKQTGGKDRKVVLAVEEDRRELLINKTNAEILAEIFGDDETDNWVGKKFQAFFDPTVKYAGRRCGGVGVRAIS